MLSKSSLLVVLAASLAVHGQFALEITKPLHHEFIKLGSTIDVEVTAPNATVGTPGPNVQLVLCTQITGIPLCNGTGTILSDAPFSAPDETYNVTIPGTQAPGVTRLIARHITEVDGVPTLTDQTSIEIFLGSR